MILKGDFAKNTSFEEFPKEEQGAGVEGFSRRRLLRNGLAGVRGFIRGLAGGADHQRQNLLVCESMKGSRG